jgi:hypothetical protein
MSIKWGRLPDPCNAEPYDSYLVLLALPNRLTVDRMDSDHPYTVHLATWDVDDRRWVTNEVDETTGETLCFAKDQPRFWAAVNLPHLSVVPEK